MPIYMDVHIIPGVKARDVAEAHQRDIFHSGEYGCKCMTYWIDEERENVFCLIEAPDKETVVEMHSRAHGLVPSKIIEVNSTLVESFLGRIYDPSDAVTEDGLKVFTDPSMRIILVTRIADPILLQHQLGMERSYALITLHSNIIRKNMAVYEGREAEHSGPGFIISFTSAAKAVECALNIQNDLAQTDAAVSGFRMSINAGEPVAGSEKLFGDTVQRGKQLCAVIKNMQLAITSDVQELISKDPVQIRGNNIITLSPRDEAFIELLFSNLEAHWQNANMNIAEYCRVMAMSKSQVYRKTIELTGISPNILLKDFRLEKAKDLMKKQNYSIAEITFESGFTSPSYFTKCFKKKYGLLPMAYLDLMH